MQNSKEKTLKDTLLGISESIVDLIEILEESDPQTEARKIQKANKELHHIGDTLLDYQKTATEDDLAFVNFMMGSVCYQLGYLGKSCECYEAALAFWPEHVGLLNEYFLALTDLKKYDEAYEVIRKSILYGGETPDVLQNMATVLVHLNRIPEAKTVLFNCMAKFPNDEDSQRFLADIDQKFK